MPFLSRTCAKNMGQTPVFCKVNYYNYIIIIFVVLFVLMTSL